MIDTLFVRFLYLSFELMFGLSVHLPVIFVETVDAVCVFLFMILIICMLISLSVNYSITYEV